jgi:hypothetical protein
MHFDSYHSSKGVLAFAQQTISTDTATNGASVDLKGFKAVTFFIASQTITDGAYIVKVQDSPDNSVWTDAESRNVMGEGLAFALADDDENKRIGYNGSERYARIVVTSSATTTGGLFSGMAIKSSPDHGPVADD